MPEKAGCLLAPLRALDLTDETGFLCGKILGDLGADIVKVEKPGGDPARSIAPFYHNIPDPEKSLYWFAFNANKRGITLDIETHEGREIFKRLVSTADFVVESFSPGYMKKLGLGYSELSKINPRIVMTSISAFGQTGPYKDYKGSDIVAMAMGGFMFLCGTPDQPPVRVSFPQSALFAGAEAAAGTLIAHYHREVTGEGQYVEVSIQESVSHLASQGLLQWEFKRVLPQRAGTFRAGLAGRACLRMIWPCKDGWVSFFLLGGKPGTATNRGLTAWMEEEGMCPDFLRKKDWDTFDLPMATQEEIDQLSEPIAKFFKMHTRTELYREALKRRIQLYPVATIKDIVEDRHLADRHFWEEVDHPELDATILYPGGFAKLSEASCKIQRRAPLIGEHNEEIYKGELGFSEEELTILKQTRII